MSHVLSLVNTFAAAWADALVRACWQGGLVIALVWAACRLWPALPPAPRCWLWRLAYAKLLLGLVWLPPLALPLLPRPVMPPPPAQAFIVQEQPALPPAAADTLPPAAMPAAPPALVPLPAPPAPAPPTPRPTLPTFQALLLIAWLLGALASLARVASAWRRALALSRACTPITNAALRADAADLCRRLGLRRVPPLRVLGGIPSPLLLGLGRPAVLLPAFVLSGSPRAEVKLMLAHELAHLARRDLLWDTVPQLAQRLFFFHPLVWLAGHEWALAQEIACDALAVQATGAPPSAYGRMLLGIATRRRSTPAALFPTLAVAAPRHTLRRRLHAMQHIGTTSRPRLILAAALTAALAVVGLLPWRVVAQSGTSLLTPPAVTQKEEASQEQMTAEFASRNAQLDAQLAAILKPLSPEQRKKAEAGIAFMDADNAKTQQHIQMLEQHRADYLAAHPNRLSDAQIALVQKVNWDRLDPSRIDEGIRWEQTIKRKLQAHLEAAQDAHSRQGWQRQIAAIDQRQQAAERRIRELGPAIAREEVEVAAIPEDQRARVAKLRSYDSEISAYKNIALMGKQMRIAILRQRIAGTLHGGRQSRGAKTKISLTQLGQGGMEAASTPPHNSTVPSNALVVSGPPPARPVQSAPTPLASVAPKHKKATVQEKMAAGIGRARTQSASTNSRVDAETAQFLKHLSPARREKARAEVDLINAEYARKQQQIQTLEKQRSDYLASHPYRASDAEFGSLAELQSLNFQRSHINSGLAWHHVVRVRLLADLASAPDSASKRGYRSQIAAIDRERLAAEKQMRAQEPLLSHEKEMVAAIPEQQRASIIKQKQYDEMLSVNIIMATIEKSIQMAELRRWVAGKFSRSKSLFLDTHPPRVIN